MKRYTTLRRNFILYAINIVLNDIQEKSLLQSTLLMYYKNICTIFIFFKKKFLKLGRAWKLVLTLFVVYMLKLETS